jgi:hypothetical protein
MGTLHTSPQRTARAELPRSIHAVAEQGARRVTCGFCWQAPGEPCTADGFHLARFLRAHRRGLITRAELVTVLATLTVIAEGAVVTEETS